MAQFLPISLVGDNLGQRHRHLNFLVRKAKECGASIQDVEALPEESLVDRLFKIDLAIELRNVDYIIRNLKDDDMLYVSRALKSTWLLGQHDIINPKYLEDVLFPEMITPAVTKMKHWLYIKLRDPAMCQEFYQHYKENAFEFAIKFLSHCSPVFILEEVPKILKKISPHSLKLLCEKCPKVAKIYFDFLATDEDLKTSYLKHETSYFDSVQCVLKSDPDVYLDITEKYFNSNELIFSKLATDYVLRYHKTRFTNKLELYVSHFLHIPILAARLSVEECQEVVLKLARANYLQHWFHYKTVEPLIKRLSPDKRAAFKKRVFVDKDVGDRVNVWPYEIPTPLTESVTGPHVFDDQNFDSDYRKSAYAMSSQRFNVMSSSEISEEYETKTGLDRLFEEFRFVSFDRALQELVRNLSVTRFPERRRDIFLVLVSKSAGRPDAVSALLRLAARHSNEELHIRASILRSLVKRACVWRVPADDWQYLLNFGHELGLDGVPAKIKCFEGLHCLVIRQLLNGECEPAVRDAFFEIFSTLAEYSLNTAERDRVAIGLQNMLIAAAVDVEPTVAAEHLGHLLDVLKSYRVRVEPSSPAVKAVVALALRDAQVARPLLVQLYNAGIARRELLQLNMEFRRDVASLLNALRHDPSALELERVVDIFAARQTNYDMFISKLMIYYNQKQDFAVKLRSVLKEKISQQQSESSKASCKNVKLARPLTSLMGNHFEKELRELDSADIKRNKFAAALRACGHRARPVVNLAEWGWRKAGVKAVATRATRSRKIERAALIRALAAERRTVRVALALSMRSAGELFLETFASAAKLRPVVALRAALPYFRRHGASSDLRVWDIVKPLLFSVDLKPRERLRRLLGATDRIPSVIKPDYCVSLFLAFNKIARSSADKLVCDLSQLLPETDESIEDILLQILDNNDKDVPAIPFPSIFVRYLLLSRNEEDVERRFTKIGNRFLERLDTLRCEKESNFDKRLDQMLESLMYNSAFFDTKYSSCLSVIERILTWMQKFMPKEEYFKKYTHVYLTMLYFKAIRQSMEQMPEVFSDPQRRKSEGVEAVGCVFGRYIVKEVAKLVTTHFDSIIELYTDALVDYLKYFFITCDSKPQFIGSILKGILVEGVGIQRRIIVFVLVNRSIQIDDLSRKEIEERIRQDQDMEMFAELIA